MMQYKHLLHEPKLYRSIVAQHFPPIHHYTDKYMEVGG